MPGRIIPLVNGEIYHIFNRGNDKRHIFTQPRDYKRFQKTFHYYQFGGPKPRFSNFSAGSLNPFKPTLENKLVEVLCYCLMPNHFHFLIRQLKNNGISIFLGQLSNSYTKYFNIKYERIGPLLQGAFKAVLVESDEQLLHLSRYIHINPIVAGLARNLDEYPWSSYKEYAYAGNIFCSTEEILSFFPSIEAYQNFLEDQIEYGQILEQIKHQLIDL